MAKTLAFFFTLTISFGLLADAGVRINKPTYRGHRLDWCKDWGVHCGKPAADEFCRQNNYAHASSFAIAADIGNTRLIGTGAICADAFCDGFEYIVCRKISETYNRPRFRGYFLDWCKDWGKNCGKPAADAFCSLKGYSKSYGFAIAADIGRTRLIGSGAICSDNFCDGFSYIKCN